jgi:hypothetical protein
VPLKAAKLEKGDERQNQREGGSGIQQCCSQYSLTIPQEQTTYLKQAPGNLPDRNFAGTSCWPKTEGVSLASG